MLAEILAIFFGAIFVAAFRWLLTVESTKSDVRKTDDSASQIYPDFHDFEFNPSTGLPMIGSFDTDGNAFGMSRPHHH